MATILPLDGAYLLGSLIGLVFYGFYAALFAATMFQLRERGGDSKIVSSILVTLFLLISGYYALTMIDCYRAFVMLRDDPGPIAYINHGYSTVLAPIEYLFVVISLFAADLLLLWRLSIVWPTNRLAMVVSAVIMTAMLGCGITTTVFLFEQALLGDGRHVQKTYRLVAVSSALVVLNNVILTSCIAGRLMWMGRQVSTLGDDAKGLYKGIIHTLIASGAGYLCVVALELVLHAIDNRSAIFLSMQMASALNGIFPTAIVFQLNFQSERRSSPRVHRSHSPKWPHDEHTASGDRTAASETVTDIQFAAFQFATTMSYGTRLETVRTKKADDLEVGSLPDLEISAASITIPEPAKVLPASAPN